jgi:hypothetical protein
VGSGKTLISPQTGSNSEETDDIGLALVHLLKGIFYLLEMHLTITHIYSKKISIW